MNSVIFLVLSILLTSSYCFGDDIKNLKEIKELPDPFLFNDETRVQKQSDWNKRRNEIKEMAQHYQYGRFPGAPDHLNATLTGSSLKIDIQVNNTYVSFSPTVNIPNNNKEQHPVLIGSSNDFFVNHSFAVININLTNIAGDHKNRTGIFYELYPESDTGVLMAWAWSYHRVIDALENMRQFNSKQIAVTGHSRYGKACLLAAVFDERVAIAFPMSSGASGAGNFRFYDETKGKAEKLSNIYKSFPWWYTPLFGQFVNDVYRLPFDQHEIIASVAPRAVLITDGTEDYWSNPYGTGISYSAAKIVYQYLGVGEHIGIAYRKGVHPPTDEDFTAQLEFADKYYNGVHYNRTFDDIPFAINKTAAIPWSAPNYLN